MKLIGVCKFLIIASLLLIALPFVQAAINDNLIVYYSFDNTTKQWYEDLTATGFNITNFANSNTTNVSGKIGSARNFAGSGFLQTPTDNKILPASQTSYNSTKRGTTTVWWSYQTSTTGSQYHTYAGNGASIVPWGHFANAATDTRTFQRGGSAGSDLTTAAHSSGVWTFNVITVDYQTNTFNYSRNGVNAGSGTVTTSTLASGYPIYIGSYGDGSSKMSGYIDEFAVWNRTLLPSEVSYLYNSGNGRSCAEINCTPSSPVASNASITVTDFYTGAALSNFSVYDNATLISSTTNGTATLPYLQNTSSLFNLTIGSNTNGGYFNNTMLNKNVSSAIATTLSQSIITFNATQKVTGSVLTANFTTVNLTNVTHYMRAQAYNVTATASGYYNNTATYTATALSTASFTFTNMSNLLANITLRDFFGNTSISSFTVNISYGSFSESQSVSGGTAQIYLINSVLYNVTITSTNFVAITLTNVNLSTNLTAYGYQVLAYITLYDLISNNSISTFNVTANTNFNSTAASNLSMFLDVGTANMTLRAPTYDARSVSYVFNSSGTYFLNYSMSRNLTINVVNESDGSPFIINTTSRMVLSIYCPNQTVTYTITAQNQSFAVCQWDYVRLDAFYASSSLFRTLVPDYSVSNFTFVMPDANTVTVYQTILRLNDLTGQFTDGMITLKKTIGSVTYDIMDQFLDVENKVVAYLIKDNFYTLLLVSQAGVQRSVGYLEAESAGTKTITVPVIELLPTTVVQGGIIVWSWSGNSSLVRFQYNDSAGSAISNLNFTLYNASNTSTNLYSTSLTNVSSATVSFNGNITDSYLACFSSYDSVYGAFSECIIYAGTITPNSVTGVSWTATQQRNTFNWIIFAFVCLILYGVGRASAAVALAICAAFLSVAALLGVFFVISYLTTGGIIALFGVLAGLSFYFEVNK